jgi:sigma-B regulation protein RsbU (phosphoserine phosphatase)
MNSADGSQILADLNRAAVDFGYKAMATAAIAAFYRADRNHHFSYAGHHEVLVKRKSDQNWKPLAGMDSDGLSGLPLGVDDETDYLQNSVPLAAGDRLFMYTDGIVEAPNNAHQEFGEQRLIEVLKSTADNDLDVIRSRVLGALLEHTGDELGHDDVTFMAVEILE